MITDYDIVPPLISPPGADGSQLGGIALLHEEDVGSNKPHMVFAQAIVSEMDSKKDSKQVKSLRDRSRKPRVTRRPVPAAAPLPRCTTYPHSTRLPGAKCGPRSRWTAPRAAPISDVHALSAPLFKVPTAYVTADFARDGVTYNTFLGSDAFSVFVRSDGPTRSARNHQQICRNYQESSEIISSLPL